MKYYDYLLIIEEFDEKNFKYIEPFQLRDTFLNFKNLVSFSFILHDNDNTRNHYHVVLRLSSPLNFRTILNKVKNNLLISIDIVSVRKCINYESSILYLVHFFESDKYQYAVNNVYTTDLKVSEFLSDMLEFGETCISLNEKISITDLLTSCSKFQYWYAFVNSLQENELITLNQYYRVVKSYFYSLNERGVK
jgi:hypothetical protein